MNKTFKYTNEYGKLILSSVSNFYDNMKMFESNVNREEKINNSFNIDDAEKIALITHNKDIQIGFFFPLNGLAYIIVYDNKKLALGKIEHLNFISKINPAEELEKLNNNYPYRVYA
jgi:hypothetical protein